MDWGSLIGLLIALAGVVIGQTMEGGHVSSLVQPAAFVIVVVGTAGAVLLQSGMKNFKAGVKLAAYAFKTGPAEPHATPRDLVLWSSTARREGLLSLERYLSAIPDEFSQKGLRLVIDGIDPPRLREILDADTMAYESRQRQAVKIWEAAGGYAPTIGILGAVLGLIHVMENLSDPSRLGAGIAVAFVATVYGVGLANLVFLPIGNKLKGMLNSNLIQRDLLAEAFCAMASGDSPRIMSERMAIYEDSLQS